MQFIFAGMLAFELLDRLTGEWSVVHTEWARAYIVDPFMNKPLVWFILSMCVWVGVAFGVYYLTREIDDRSAGAISYRIKVNKPLNLEALDEYLAMKSIIGEDGVADEAINIQRVRWQEEDITRWEGYLPIMEMVYDVKHGFLLDVHLTITRRASAPAKLRPETLKIRFFTELQEAAVLTPEDAATVIDNTRRMRAKVGTEVVEEQAVCLKVKVPNERYYREIPFGRQTYLELREEIALKFRVKPVQVLQIFKVPDTLIADDDDVTRITPDSVLEILLKSH
jgi:WD repeat-containing protein 35